MDEHESSPAVALHLCLLQSQCKAVQDAVELLPIDIENSQAPLHITKDKLRIHTSGQANRNGLKQQRMAEVQPHMIFTPSVSVVLFTLDTDLQMSKSDLCRQKFAGTPWKFHHLTEVNTTSQSTNRIHCKQEFYELMPDLPLFSLSTTHFGKQILRINIVTYNHSEMAAFYRNIFQQPGVYVRSNFTYFTFPYNKELTLQFALKSSTELMPYPTDGIDLILSLHNLPTDLELSKVSKDLYSVTDPDQNCLLIHTPASPTPAHVNTPSDLVMANKELPVSKEHSSTTSSLKRPDVIPSQDCYITSLQIKTAKPVVNSLNTRRRSGSPVVGRKNLAICNTLSISGSHVSLTEINNNQGQYKRRHSIDVLESF